MNSCNTDKFLATTIICSLSALNPKGKNMAANRCGKKAKTAKEALEEILEQSNEFLKKTSKPKKKSHFFHFSGSFNG